MAMSQPAVAVNILNFSLFSRPPVQISIVDLTPRDKMDLDDLRETAALAGFDQLIIHQRDDGDCDDVGTFLTVHQRGEAWSRWSFARRGDVIRAWCSQSWTDKGEFSTLASALETVLGLESPAGDPALSVTRRRSAVVTDIGPRLRVCGATRLGSAA